MLNHKLVRDRPKSPCKNSDPKPPNVAGAHKSGLEFCEQVREVCVTAWTATHFPETTPQELGHNTSEEYMVQVFRGVAKKAMTISGAVSFENLYFGGKMATDPLP